MRIIRNEAIKLHVARTWILVHLRSKRGELNKCIHQQDNKWRSSSSIISKYVWFCDIFAFISHKSIILETEFEKVINFFNRWKFFTNFHSHSEFLDSTFSLLKWIPLLFHYLRFFKILHVNNSMLVSYLIFSNQCELFHEE